MSSFDNAPVDEGIRAGLLPLRLASGRDRRDSDRAVLLLRSIRHFWAGNSPFHLHVVGRNDEVNLIKQLLAPLSGGNVEVIVHPERDFFPIGSLFYDVRPEYKQQLIKLFVPPNIGIGRFVTFDADVVCIRKFDEHTFIRDGALISRWEDKGQLWWEGSMRALRCWSDASALGLSVTPNTLHAVICRQVSDYLSLRGLDPISELCRLAQAHVSSSKPGLAWSEYSLYTIVGEWFGSLSQLHLLPQAARDTGVQMFSSRCVWRKAEEDRLSDRGRDAGFFLVVQSWADVPLSKVECLFELAKRADDVSDV